MAAVHVLLAGPGLIGGELLQQLETARPRGVAVKLVGVANSRRYLLRADGLPPATAKHALQEGGTEGDVLAFVAAGAALRLPNTVFVDCTASDAVSPAYSEALKRHLHVVAANKKVNSGPLSYRKEVLELAGQPAGPRFRYEANVGAGLPIIRPLQDFVETGDEVLEIEAILSGTLAYLFNTLSAEVSFSEAVKKAKDLGFTEPDPRDDLNGSDVARKIVILAREAGHDVELDDVVVESFLPASCADAPDVEAFFAALKADVDGPMERRRSDAAARGECLRFIATLNATASPPTMKLSLREVPNSHPAATITGSDNICILRTQRYSTNPCVIKGPGAGAAVTAAGVFGDILSLRDSSVVPKSA